jgi:tRNA threonylcarbamoyladenosine biosynthesis protein TsaE
MKYLTHSAEETKAIARELATTLKGGEFIALIGDLGAGKTTFSQGLVDALGSKARVKSPTFTVMNEYRIDPPKNGIVRVIHVDFYRFSKETELGALSLEDEMRADTVIVAEWPNVFDREVYEPDIKITLTHKGGDEREIEVETGD